MAFVLKRNLHVEVEMDEGSVIELDMTDLKATERIDYMHEIEVLQDRMEEGDKSAVKDIYMLNINLLVSQVTDVHGIENQTGDKVKLPKEEVDRKDLFDSLGIDFITKACNAYAKAMSGSVKKGQS